MIRIALLFLGVAAAVLPVHEQVASGDLLAGARCADAVRTQLRDWSAVLDHAIVEPPGPIGDRSLRIPTTTLGLWVRMTVDPAGEVELIHLRADEAALLRFGPSCSPQPVQAGDQMRLQRGFSDRDLAARLAKGDSGVILVWSPHMPLSVDQYGVLVDVTKELGLSLIAVLDPGANVDYARRVAAERLMPASAAQPIGGIELEFRGMTTHAPSVLVFADGKLKGRVLYGYRSHDAARLAITEVLEGR